MVIRLITTNISQERYTPPLEASAIMSYATLCCLYHLRLEYLIAEKCFLPPEIVTGQRYTTVHVRREMLGYPFRPGTAHTALAA